MNIATINNRINDEYCNNTIEQLNDNILLNEYKKCKSVKNSIDELSAILDRHVIDETKNKIIGEYLLKLIPAGTKGIIRGNKFNDIIKNMILNLHLNNDRFEILFEKKCEIHQTHEIPDWYILEKSTQKIIIGMNQLDLWNGGHQINRGYKYIMDEKINTPTKKLLCVICNKIVFKNNTSKPYKLFERGFENNTLCYVKGLRKIIMEFFK